MTLPPGLMQMRFESGGCLCGQPLYEADGAPMFQGHCYCCDCRKTSGSGFIPFMGFPARALSPLNDTHRDILRRPLSLRRGEERRESCFRPRPLDQLAVCKKRQRFRTGLFQPGNLERVEHGRKGLQVAAQGQVITLASADG